MLSINQQMKYLRNTHNIAVKSNQSRALRNIGYYHGYKGFRYIRKKQQVINFTSLDEIIALNKFDMQLKTILYPKVMFIETALKSYAIEALLLDCKSENLDDIFEKSIINYKNHKRGSKEYRDSYTKRMNLKGKINSLLVRDYKNRDVVKHFFNMDRSIPVWAMFETLSLGEFGILFDCSGENVKKYVSSLLELPTNLDSDGMITSYFIFALKDLRNAIAHNNVIFDARFKTSKINDRLPDLLEREIGLYNIDFRYLDTYIIMITYFLMHLGETKTSCKKFISMYNQQIESIRKELPADTCNKIIGTAHRGNMIKLNKFITNF